MFCKVSKRHADGARTDGTVCASLHNGVEIERICLAIKNYINCLLWRYIYSKDDEILRQVKMILYLDFTVDWIGMDLIRCDSFKTSFFQGHTPGIKVYRTYANPNQFSY